MFRWRDATRCPTVRISRQEKMVFESSSESRKSWDGRKMTRQCIPNFWCDRRKRSRGCHGGFAQRNTYWQGWRRAEWSHRCIAWNECSEVGGLLCLQDRVSDGSYLEIYSAPTISLGSHQNIELHTGARANAVLLTYLLTYSVTNGKPVQFRQNRRDMIKARLLGHNACKGILNKL